MKVTIIVTAIAVCMLLACAAYATAPAPVFVTNRGLGGGALNQYTPGVAGGTGLNNIGLLIRTYGRVTYVDTVNQFFCIDDGSGCTTKLPDTSVVAGVRVSYGGLVAGVTITPPALNSHVAITGVVSTAMVGTLVLPNVRPRNQDDILPLP